MKKSTLAITLLTVLIFGWQSVFAQSVMDPADPIMDYDTAAPPVEPVWGTIGKWVRTPRLSWNTSAYKSYIYNGSPFRLKFPKTYNPAANDGKKYPMMIFFHGLGEGGVVYDNEYHLLNGGEYFQQVVDNGTFDGYILAMQSNGAFGPTQFQKLVEIINYMVSNNKLDPFQVTLNGLSAGGQATWDFVINHPQYAAAILPMSWSSLYYADAGNVNKFKRLPIWVFQGGQDGNPAPGTTEYVKAAIDAAGGNLRYQLYPTLGHGTWWPAWGEPDFWDYQKRAYMSNPWPLFGRTEFCPNEPISVDLVLQVNMDAYEWRKDGVVIPGATTSVLNVTSVGIYEARVRRNGLWSEWSRVPVNIRIKQPTVSPTITISGMASRVLPAPDGSTSVQLEVPAGYATYQWKRVGDTATLGTTRTLTVSTPGDYIVKVTEQFGCSSDFSAPLTVVNANGQGRPDGVIGLTATALSQTRIRLDWADVPTPQFNETGFEVYQATQQGGPYQLVGLTGADVRNFTATGLGANTTYFYIVRAVNNTGASAPSVEVQAKTISDNSRPTAPRDLVVLGTSRNAVQIRWTRSLDNVGIQRYEIYVNGQKTFITTDTTFLVSGLSPNSIYNFTVTAVDAAGNVSPHSNQVTAQTILKGLAYKYYTFNDTWMALPDFNTLAPNSSGIMSNVFLNPRTQNDRFAFLWEGYIKIPVAGVYTFRTNSDDGSKLWLGSLNASGSPYNYAAPATVSNDGLHGSQDSTSVDLNLVAGIYPIAIAYYEQGGGESFSVTWKNPETSGSFAAIPDSAFTEAPAIFGQPPVKPTNLTATAVSSRQINLAWADNSNNEVAFEVWRSTNPLLDFLPVAQVGSNTTSYQDTGLNANTRYYYRVRAIGQYGESDFDRVGQGVEYQYYEQNNLSQLPDFNAIQPVTSGRQKNFALGMQRRPDNFQIRFSGILNIPVTGVYTFAIASDDGSRLYIGGMNQSNMVIDHDGLHPPTEMSGHKLLARGSYPIYVTYMEATGGESINVKIAGPGLPMQDIPDAMLGTPLVSAITVAPTNIPAFPDNLVATAQSKTTIALNWNDRSNNETGFELFRSNGNNSDYFLYASLPAGTTSFVDSNLYANGIFYYKVRAINGSGSSIFSTEDSSKTFNTAPQVTALVNRTARYGTTTTIAISASDPDGDALSFAALNLPSFASLVDSGNRRGSIVLNPSAAQQGVYTNIRIIARDPHQGADTTAFTLTVNDNFDPVIAAIANQSLVENDVVNLQLTATDQNPGAVFTWSVTGLPSQFTLTPGANGTATLTLKPGYASAGTYTVAVTVADGQGGFGTQWFNLQVTDKNPNRRIYVRVNSGNAIGQPWNNVTGTLTSNLKDEANVATGFNLNLQTSQYFSRNDGPTTGNNSGVYPDAVLRDYFYSGTWWTPGAASGVLSGLNPAKRYNLTFFGATTWHELTQDNGNTNYTAGGKTVSLYVENNTDKTVSINGIQPAPDGTLTFNIAKGTGASAAILNSLVIYELENDGVAPAAPASLVAQNLPGKGVQLGWEDRSYNEAEFEVYRASSASGPFTLIGTATSESIRFLDESTSGFTTYYYRVRAVNEAGASAYTSTIGITSPNRLPKITNINSMVISNNASQQIQITAVDDASDVITFSTSNLPFFVSLANTGNGTAQLNINPTKAAIGLYKDIRITATDSYGASSSTTFDILVKDNNLTRIYLNFSDGALYADRPWNNLSSWPFPNTTLGNISDESGTPTSITIKLPDGFTGMGQLGAKARNGRDLLPENVITTGYYESSSDAKRVLVSGLNPTRRYNFIFFSSRGDGNKTSTNFTIGTETVNIDGSNNIARSAQINGILPDANGDVTITVQKAGGAVYAMLNDMIIEEYNPASITLLGPASMQVLQSTLNSITLNWQDRASNETGYDIYRAPAGGSYSLLASLAANTTTYVDAGLPSNTAYYYIVRAKNGTANSDYSNPVLGYTYANRVQINFTTTKMAPLPWNNTGPIPQVGFRWNNFTDNSGLPSSLGMIATSTWDGLYDAGMTTGSNSGIFPDAVLGENYGLFPGRSATVRLTGLQANMRYDLMYFASAQTTGNVISSYSVGGQSVLLNAAQNTSGTVTMYSVVADAFGNVDVTVAPGAGSSFGLLGALVVQGYSPVSVTPPAPLPRLIREITVAPAVVAPASEVSVYPNPFRTHVIVSVDAREGERITASLVDMGGKVVVSQPFGKLYNGVNLLKVQPSQQLPPGIYVLRIDYLDRKESKVIKLIKR